MSGNAGSGIRANIDTNIGGSPNVGQPPSPREIRMALAWMVLACLMFALVMVSIRLFLTDLPPQQSVCLRYALGVLFLAPFIKASPLKIIRSPVRGMIVLRAILHGAAVFLWFYAVLRIPLAEINAMLNLGPVYATIGAALFLGERLRLRRIAAICVAFTGAMIIIKPGFAEIGSGTIAVMFTAMLFAASDLFAKNLKQYHDDNSIIVSLSIGIALLMLGPAIAVWQPMSVQNWIGVLAISVSATFGHVSLMKSFSGPMWAAQSGKYIQLLFVVAFGIFLFDEIPDLSVLVGAVVVLSGVSYIAVREGRLRAQENAQ